MPAWSSANVKQLLPEFDSISDAVVNAYIAAAARQIREDLFPERIVEAGVLLTGHLMAVLGVLGGSAGVTGAVAGVTVGQVSVTYAQAAQAASAASLGKTRYGIEFLALCMGAGLGTMVI